MQDKYEFGTFKGFLDPGSEIDDVRLAIEEFAPAVKHAAGEKIAQADGSFLFKFVEKAGVKG